MSRLLMLLGLVCVACGSAWGQVAMVGSNGVFHLVVMGPCSGVSWRLPSGGWLSLGGVYVGPTNTLRLDVPVGVLGVEVVGGVAGSVDVDTSAVSANGIVLFDAAGLVWCEVTDAGAAHGFVRDVELAGDGVLDGVCLLRLSSPLDREGVYPIEFIRHSTASLCRLRPYHHWSSLIRTASRAR